MSVYERIKKSRSKSALFDPHKNGISTYDVAYLSSKRCGFKNKTFKKVIGSNKYYFAA